MSIIEIEPIIAFMKEYAFELSLFSFILFFGTIIVTVIIILRLPENYWQQLNEIEKRDRHPIRIIIRNAVAMLLAVTGFLMLFLPGQGILTLLIALILSDIPFRRKLLIKLLKRPQIQRGLNSFRKRFKRRKIDFDT